MRKLILLFTAVFLLSAFSACSSGSDSSSDFPKAETPADTTQPEVKYFAVTFETFGGTDIAPQSVESGKTATKPTDPVVEGLIFAGWYTDSDCTSIFSFDEPITEHIILYAKWIDSSVPTFTVHFETEYVYVSNQTVESGKTAAKPTDPKMFGYIFKGWYTDTDFTELFNFDEPITKDIVLYAKWIVSFTVTFEADGGSPVDSQTVEPGKTATKPTDPTREGLVFAGWYTDVDCTTVFNFDEPITKDIVLYAKWIDVPTYTVTFDTNGGSSVESQVVKSGTCVSEPAAPTKETVCENGHESEYEFAGWYTDSGFSEQFNFGSAVIADTTLYAKWNVRLSVEVKDGASFNTFLENTLNALSMRAFKRASEAPSTTPKHYLDNYETDPLIPIWYDTSSGTVFYYVPDNVCKLKIESLYHMFFSCSSLKELDMSGFDTSNVKDMSSMFYGCNSLTKLDLSGFDTSKVTNMRSMFYYCTSLTELDLSGFDTGNVTNMSYMFYNCSSLTELDVSGFDTGNVTNMSYMFDNCISLTELDVSGFDTGNVTNMNDMFYKCSSLTGLDVRGFDTSKATDMSRMFYNCNSLTELDVSGFDTGNVTNMSYMFYNCNSLTGLDVRGFDTSKVTDMSSMFYNCSSLTELDVSGFDTGNVTEMSGMFYNCSSLVTIYASPSADWNMSTGAGSYNMFFNCEKLKGGNGTEYSSSKVNVTYAHVDTEGNPGYFTAKN